MNTSIRYYAITYSCNYVPGAFRRTIGVARKRAALDAPPRQRSRLARAQPFPTPRQIPLAPEYI